MGRDQVSGGVSVPCRHATLVADALWKPIFGEMPDTVIISSPVIMSQTVHRLIGRRWSQQIEQIQVQKEVGQGVRRTIFILQTFYSWIATRPLCPLMGLFTHSSDTPGLAPLTYAWFIARAVRLFNKLLGQEYVTERLKSSLSKIYGQCVDLIKQYELPLSGMFHDILEDEHIQWNPP